MEKTILIKNGHVYDPYTDFNEYADILVRGTKIEKIGKVEEADVDQVIDASGLTVAPGLVDIHVHFRTPGFEYKESVETGASAAAAGGFTTVVSMANTNPVLDEVSVLTELMEREKTLPIHVLNTAAVTKGLKGKKLTDMKLLKEAGAVGFTDDGIPIKDVKLIADAMRTAKELDVPISLHEEDPDLLYSSGINYGEVAKTVGVGGATPVAEQTLIARDCLIARFFGTKVNIQHVSSAVSVDVLRFVKSIGANVFAEVTPQHFSLTEQAVLEKGSLAKVNPPLRTEEDRMALITGLQDDIIDFIVTDHAPHSKEEKEKPLKDAPSGMIGLETSLALGITNLVRKGYLTMPHFLEKMTSNPAALYHLDCGRLKEGGAADIVIFDPDEKWTVPDTFRSRSSNSPFIGDELYGKVKYTICEGKIVYQDN